MAQHNPLQERIPFIPPADTPANYNPPFQTQQSIKDPDYCIPIEGSQRFNTISMTRDLPFTDGIYSPQSYFKLFFTEQVLDLIVESTNLYAQRKRETDYGPHARPWVPLTQHKLILWLGIVLYISYLNIPMAS